ncbi:MAG: bifunctional heptose 7-phosphate kinase/heptose 1-phosphate adenyltransferase [Acidiferrobacteraceae bacterium]|nr:bifunctional heptose 7-phosphate kinase/heptose 1-phosphate adenyltransferase [Acidiferrobacteraceae bacterium]MBT4393629.1 bifunctional heptose 7-phosphate kinase/heptose 1-phosphate adenyltransferase [Acidiferrobacteraceae bacterium]MBT4806182.1 bifunctional heptose 7-phosphate kinase/heptose 1-phosphate adenyltransferase [Acidiferrobacteraceae bacterium]MBT5981374.1 bifunctional heptose 7-phosphate kinase/heptose 1-phosphate adenyltransferase [Acidiferrobacteraceae bacterium]MBT6786796.1 
MNSTRKIILDPKALKQRVDSAQRPLVFTNGCFDILHRGHITYLEEAAGLGVTLLVALNTDDSVRQLDKGPGRPINSLEDRMALVAALECVSLVTAFDEATPLELIRQIKPDHLIKGGDWSQGEIVGADIVQAAGGTVHSLPFRYQRSTTELIHRLRDPNRS